MNLKFSLLLIPLLIFVGGCTDQTGQTSQLESCSHYDGTWKGIISDSGSIETTRYVDNKPVITSNPFTAQYDFEMTIEYGADREYYDIDHVCAYKITKVKVSHPLFGCTSGCVPVQEEGDGTYASWMSVDKDGYGMMYISFSNGASIPIFAGDDRIRLANDKIELYLPADVQNYETIGEVGDPTKGEELRQIETDNCIKMGNDFCIVEYLNKNTIVLNRIS